MWSLRGMRPVRRDISSALALAALAGCSASPTHASRPPAIPAESPSDTTETAPPPTPRGPAAPRGRCSPETSLATLCERWLQTEEQKTYAECGARDCEEFDIAAFTPKPGIVFHGLTLSHGYCDGTCEPRIGVRGLQVMGEPTSGGMPGCPSRQGIDYVLLVMQQGPLYWPVLQATMTDGIGDTAVHATPLAVEQRDARRLEVSFTDRGNYADDDGGTAEYARSNLYAFDFSGGRLTPLSRTARVQADEGAATFFSDVKDLDASCSFTEPECAAACPF